MSTGNQNRTLFHSHRLGPVTSPVSSSSKSITSIEYVTSVNQHSFLFQINNKHRICQPTYVPPKWLLQQFDPVIFRNSEFVHFPTLLLKFFSHQISIEVVVMLNSEAPCFQCPRIPPPSGKINRLAFPMYF